MTFTLFYIFKYIYNTYISKTCDKNGINRMGMKILKCTILTVSDFITLYYLFKLWKVKDEHFEQKKL